MASVDCKGLSSHWKDTEGFNVYVNFDVQVYVETWNWIEFSRLEDAWISFFEMLEQGDSPTSWNNPENPLFQTWDVWQTTFSR
jgi:hypothetical protein